MVINSNLYTWPPTSADRINCTIKRKNKSRQEQKQVEERMGKKRGHEGNEEPDPLPHGPLPFGH